MNNTFPRFFMYSDENSLGDINDCTSNIWYIIYIFQNPVSWSFKKQHIVASFSTKAENRSFAYGLIEVNLGQKHPAELHVQLP